MSGFLQEVDDLDSSSSFGLVDAGDVGEGRACRLGRVIALGLRAAEARQARGAAAGAAGGEDEEADEQQRRAEEEQDVGEQRAAVVQRLGGDDDALLAQLVEQLVVRRREGRPEGRELRLGLVVGLLGVDLGLEGALQAVALGEDALDVVLVDLVKELRVGHLDQVRRVRDERRKQEVQGQQRDDEVESGGLGEAAACPSDPVFSSGPPSTRTALAGGRPCGGVLLAQVACAGARYEARRPFPPAARSRTIMSPSMCRDDVLPFTAVHSRVPVAPCRRGRGDQLDPHVRVQGESPHLWRSAALLARARQLTP